MKGNPTRCNLGRLAHGLLPFLILASLLLGMLPFQTALAEAPTPVIDQSFTEPAGALAGINDCCRYVAQTFTAGMTGALTAVSLDVLPISDRFLKVAIHGVTNGLPNDTVYSEVFVWGGPATAPLSYATLDLKIDVGAIYVKAGRQYAIVVYYDGAPAPGQAEGNWVGAAGNYYLSGAAYATNDETFSTWTALGTQPLDLHFKTYVVPNVPVSDLRVTRVSGARRARACEVFQEIYRIKNLGPDAAHNVILAIGLTDQFDVLRIQSIPGRQPPPFTLARGQSMLIRAVIKVTAFVPMESRDGRVSAHVFTDVWPNIAIDPNEANDYYFGSVRLVSRPRTSCPD
jgi:hypothetical protein